MSTLNAMGGALAKRIAEKPKEIVVEISENSVIVNKSVRLEVQYGDNIMVLEDQFENSYKCKVCKGSGRIRVDCEKCSGQGKNRFDTACADCSGQGFLEPICEACKGLGELLAIPEISQGRPTSGVVVSRGDQANFYPLGTRVAYTSFSGHLIPLRNNNRIRVMRQTEVMCTITSVSENPVDIEFIDTDIAYEMR